MAITRKEGYDSIMRVIQLENEGVNVDSSILQDLDYENTYLEQVRACFDWNFDKCSLTTIPEGFRLAKTGFFSPLYYNHKSELSIVKENDRFYLIDSRENVIDEIKFEHKPRYYNKKTSDGKDMSRIVQANSIGRLNITYSNECALQEQDLCCLFCNINATKKRFGEVDRIEWKDPNQIAETIAEGYKEGFRGFNLSGGFVPERREVEYYLDVIEKVIEITGTEDVHGMACVGAPSAETIEQYREAGYQHIATNLEIWDENIFKTICPGKDQICGGQKNWIAALKKEVEIFGKGNVRSIFVGGIEPKDSLLEGIEYLASIGVLAVPNIWRPCIGSGLEGHRSPTSEWHQEVAEKTYQIHKRYGFTLEQFYYVYGRESCYSYFQMLDGAKLEWEDGLEIINE